MANRRGGAAGVTVGPPRRRRGVAAARPFRAARAARGRRAAGRAARGGRVGGDGPSLGPPGGDPDPRAPPRRPGVANGGGGTKPP